MTEPEDRFPNWSTGFYERRVPKLFGITKAIKLESGDGWKDTGRKGDVDFVYAREMRAPYAAGSFMCVGNPISSVNHNDSRFEKPRIRDLLGLLPRLYQDLKRNRGRLSLMFGPHILKPSKIQ